MGADHDGEPAERRERAGHALPAQPLEAGRRGGEPGQQRIGKISEHRGRHVIEFDRLEQAIDENREQHADAERYPAHARVDGWLRTESQPSRHERDADHAAKRQHGQHVAMRRGDDFDEHVGDAKDDCGGNSGRRGKDGTEGQGEEDSRERTGPMAYVPATRAATRCGENYARFCSGAGNAAAGERRSMAFLTKRAARPNGARSSPLMVCAYGRSGSTPNSSFSGSAAGTYKVPNIQSHKARQLPRFLLKWAGLREW